MTKTAYKFILNITAFFMVQLFASVKLNIFLSEEPTTVNKLTDLMKVFKAFRLKYNSKALRDK